MTKTKRPLKIIQIATFYAPVVGGMETQIEDLSKRLLAAGHAVEVLTTDAARGGRRVSRKSDEFEGLKVTRVRNWFSLTQFHKFAPGFYSQLRKREFDVLHVHGIRKPEMYIALLWAKLRRKRIVVSTHNPFTTVNRSLLTQIFIALHDVTFGFLFMRFVDHYFLINASEIPLMRQFGVKKAAMTVIGNAVDDSFFEEVAVDRASFLRKLGVMRDYKRIVLGVGRLNINKGFQNLAYAARNLPDTLFVIVGGDDGYQQQLERLYSDYDNVVMTKTFLPRRQLLEYYANADIFVLPSLHEPFGIVLLEAMAQHCAVVATNNGGPVDIINPKGDDKVAVNASNHGILLNPENHEGWLERLKLLLEDEKLLRVYQGKAYNRVKDFTWENILPVYLRVYNKR